MISTRESMSRGDQRLIKRGGINDPRSISTRESMSRGGEGSLDAAALEALAIEILLNDPRSISARESIVARRRTNELPAVATHGDESQRAGAEQ